MVRGDPGLTVCVVSCVPGSGVQAGLRQEASLSGSLGQKVTLSCTGNSHNVGARTVGWDKQVTGGAPKTVKLGISLPSGVLDRFSGSKSGNTALLLIIGLWPEDEADCHCSTWDTGIGITRCFAHGDLRQNPLLPSSP